MLTIRRLLMTRCELAMPPVLKTSQGDKRHRNDVFWQSIPDWIHFRTPSFEWEPPPQLPKSSGTRDKGQGTRDKGQGARAVCGGQREEGLIQPINGASGSDQHQPRCQWHFTTENSAPCPVGLTGRGEPGVEGRQQGVLASLTHI